MTVTGNGASAGITIACVYRTGGRIYSPRYVRVLHDMIARHVSVPYRFVCLSDVDVPCDRIPLVTDWLGFYSKIELFRPGLFSGPVLYFDLDTIVHRSIDELVRLACTVDFGCVSDPLGGHMNSSVLCFNGDYSFIFERFKGIGAFDRMVRHHAWFALRRLGLERPLTWGSSFGDQGFEELCLKEAGVKVVHLDHLLPKCFSTFNFTADAMREPSGSICLMMNRPKPHEIGTGWVQTHWRLTSEWRVVGSSAVLPGSVGQRVEDRNQ